MFLTRICVWALGSAARTAIWQKLRWRVSRSLSSARFRKSLKTELLLSTYLNESNRTEKRVRPSWMSLAVAEDVGQVLRVSDPPSAGCRPARMVEVVIFSQLAVDASKIPVTLLLFFSSRV
jgi:hypothetical protein